MGNSLKKISKAQDISFNPVFSGLNFNHDNFTLYLTHFKKYSAKARGIFYSSIYP
jgi:hypothetical protein